MTMLAITDFLKLFLSETYTLIERQTCYFQQGHNIFANLSSKEYSNMMQLLKQAILSTDLTLYFQ